MQLSAGSTGHAETIDDEVLNRAITERDAAIAYAVHSGVAPHDVAQLAHLSEAQVKAIAATWSQAIHAARADDLRTVEQSAAHAQKLR